MLLRGLCLFMTCYISLHIPSFYRQDVSYSWWALFPGLFVGGYCERGYTGRQMIRVNFVFHHFIEGVCLSVLRFSVGSLGSFVYRATSSAKRDTLWLLFLYLPLYFHLMSYCLITLAHISSTVMNRSGEKTLVSDLSGNHGSFSPFGMVVAIGLPHLVF